MQQTSAITEEGLDDKNKDVDYFHQARHATHGRNQVRLTPRGAHVTHPSNLNIPNQGNIDKICMME